MRAPSVAALAASAAFAAGAAVGVLATSALTSRQQAQALASQAREVSAVRAAVEAIARREEGSRCPAPVDVGPLREEILRLVREEVAACALPPPRDEAQPAPAHAARAPAPPTPAQVTAFGAAQDLLEEAVASGRWGDRDAARLRTLLDEVDASQRTEALRRLSLAINEGQLRVETAGPPL